MNRKIKKEDGFTLTETMVVILVFTVVMSLSLTVFLSNVKIQRDSLFHQRLTVETSYVLNRVEEMIREGEEVDNSNIESIVRGIMYYDVENISEEPIQIENAKVESIEEELVTVLLETSIKTAEEAKIDLKLQTTAKRRQEQ